MRFGIFDWIDENRPLSLAELYEQRLRMLEYADRAGFWGYHLAEHHGTTLGMAPSPSLFLAAAAQRTQQLRLGSLVHLLPLYNPLRHIEELCMLDHLTNGRLELGVGRGTSATELALFNVDQAESRAMFQEALDIVLDGLATGGVSYTGRYFQFKDVTLPLRPLQQPYPPLWYPTSNASSVPWIAEQGLNLLLSSTTPSWPETAELLAQYLEIQTAHQDNPNRLNAHVADPKYGFSRHVYVGSSDAEADQTARRAFEVFEANYTNRPGRRAGDHYAARPDYDTAVEEGRWIVGSAATVRDRYREYVSLVGGNYVVAVFAYGNLTTDQVLGSIGRFAEEVIPALV